MAMPTYICDWSLYGAWIIFVPVRNSNSALPRWDGLPTYDEPYDTASGRALAALLRSERKRG